MNKVPWIDSLSTFIHHKKPYKFCFVVLKCQKCCDLRAFLGVKSGLTILVRVKIWHFATLMDLVRMWWQPVVTILIKLIKCKGRRMVAIDDCQNDQMVDGWWCRPSGTRLDLLSASTLDPVADRPLPRTRPNIKHSFSTFQIVKKFSWGQRWSIYWTPFCKTVFKK